jgi:hypothetical protein
VEPSPIAPSVDAVPDASPVAQASVAE